MKRKLYFVASFILSFSFIYGQDVTDITILEPVQGAVVEWVNVTQPFTATSVNVVSGNSYTIICDGVVSTQGGSYKQNRYYVGPDGLGYPAPSGFPLPNFSQYCVIGKIGDNGQVFYVGKVFCFKANISGTLYLGYNDTGFFDNVGFYVAYIFGQSYFPTTSVLGTHNDLPSSMNISQNYPNPFNPTTTIEYDVPRNSNVEIKIYDARGALVKNLLNENSQTGKNRVVWEGKNDNGFLAASGVYFYQIKCNNELQTKKMILLK